MYFAENVSGQKYILNKTVHIWILKREYVRNKVIKTRLSEMLAKKHDGVRENMLDCIIIASFRT